MGNNNGTVSSNRQRQQMNSSATGKNFTAGISNTFKLHFHLKKRLFESKILTTKSLSGDPIKWNLETDFMKFENMTVISIAIQLIDAPTDELPAKISFEIKNPLRSDPSKLEVMDQTFTTNGDRWHFRKFIKRGAINVLFGTVITIVCSINLEREIGIPDSRILENMENMFEESILADCRIFSGNKEYKVHKNILACQSPVFRAMFEHEMVENKSEMVKIDDIESEVVKQMLRFIYTDKAPKLEEMPKELMAAADKYQLDRLKALCESLLVNSIENENVCELLVLADLHSALHLKAKALNYIQKHIKEVMGSDGWKIMEANYGKLVSQILAMMVASK